MGDRRVWAIVLLLGGSFAGVLGVWEAQAYSMKREFTRVMLGAGVENTPLLMQDKVWTERELRGVRVVRVPRSYGKEQALIRAAHKRGSGIITNERYSYQAVLTDSATGIKHVYGRLRNRPGVWVYDTIHPDSAVVYIDQRDEAIREYREKEGR
ncbi:MAG TPA: hypothetical protein VMZ06_15880 [Candidatus Bathyarchaeia archaeon]|nr:hypothetical protein [Candidatus Bathyarchaeia archaeon]